MSGEGGREYVSVQVSILIFIYFILKITYPISTLPEHLHSTNPDINRMVGCAISTNNKRHNR